MKAADMGSGGAVSFAGTLQGKGSLGPQLQDACAYSPGQARVPYIICCARVAAYPTPHLTAPVHFPHCPPCRAVCRPSVPRAKQRTHGSLPC